MRDELSALKASTAELERKLAELASAVGATDAALRSLREELTALKRSNADLERRLAQGSSPSVKDTDDVSKPGSRGGPKSDKTDGKTPRTRAATNGGSGSKGKGEA